MNEREKEKTFWIKGKYAGAREMQKGKVRVGMWQSGQIDSLGYG